jgi:hypothetical protein
MPVMLVWRAVMARLAVVVTATVGAPTVRPAKPRSAAAFSGV